MFWEDRRVIAKVATLYYLNGWTQAKIAEKYEVSRPFISKALQRARELGIVEFYIKDESIHTIEFEQKLEAKYNLKEAIVVSSTNLSEIMLMKSIGKAAAYYVSHILNENMTVGISWGNTLAAVVEEFPFLKLDSINIVPLVGGMGNQSVEIHSNHLAFKLATKLNGSCTYLYAPAIVESKELRDWLIQSDDISSVIKKGKNVDIALVGIGNPYDNSTMENIGYVTHEDMEELKTIDVIGDINSQFYDETGNFLEMPLNNQVIGIDLDSLQKINRVIAIANGVHKASAIKVSLESDFIDILITDDLTAKKILQED